MSADPTPVDGMSRFVADLEDEGCEPTVSGGVVSYNVVPATGTRAGQKVPTGVSVDELQGWPMTPPHWIHLRDYITFTQTNSDTQDCPPGWHRHSRDTGQWDMSRRPIHLWLSHVRGVIGEAV